MEYLKAENYLASGGLDSTGIESAASRLRAAQRANENNRSLQTKAGDKAGRQLSKITIRKNISAASYMMVLANAKSPSQVSSVMRRARADKRFVKNSASTKADVAKAVRILDHVVKKGNLKLSRLKKEELMEAQRKIAEGLEKHKLEREIADKLRKIKNSRKSVEGVEACDPRQVTIEKEMKQDMVDFTLSAEAAGTMSPALVIPTEPAGAEAAGGGVDVIL